MKFTISMPNYFEDDLSERIFIDNIIKYKEFIFDVNFTCSIYPFVIDAHSLGFGREQNINYFNRIMQFQKQTGIRFSAVLNNIFVPNDQRNMHEFLGELNYYYDEGLRSVTIPHSSWVYVGNIKKRYPELFIKNTVLRNVSDANSFYNAAKGGFDCVNINRKILRNITELSSIKNAQEIFLKKTGKYVYTSIVSNEDCFGDCFYSDEHYQHSMTSNYAIQNISQVAFNYIPEIICRKEHPEHPARSRYLGFYEEYSKKIQYYDIIKLAGRRLTINNLFNPFGYIENLKNKNNVPSNIFSSIISNTKYEDIIFKWRIKTMDCKFECYKCDLCKKLLVLNEANKMNKNGL